MKKLIKYILILIAVLKSIRGEESVVYAEVGEAVTLNPPQLQEAQSKYYLYWYDENGAEVAWRNALGGSRTEKYQNAVSLNGESLVVKTSEGIPSGTFVCKRVHGGRDLSVASFKIRTVNVSLSQPSPLLPGESVTLACDVQAEGRRMPEIHWFNPQGEKVKNNQRSFTVTAKGEYSGQWTCVITHNGKEKKIKIYVAVVGLSPAPVLPQYTSQSSPLTIPCSINAGVSWEQVKAKGISGGSWRFLPKPRSSQISGDPQRLFSLSVKDSLTWTADQDRGLSPVSNHRYMNLSLIRNNGREDDSGVYECTLNFRNGLTLNSTVHVQVLQIVSSSGTELISGQQVNLTCSPGYPLPSGVQLKWFPPKKSSQYSLASDHHHHLMIPEVGEGDGGKWRCELWHSNAWLTSAEITLKIEPKMSMWMLVIICSAAVIAILVLILVFILCRRRQRMRHLRHRLCQCKHPKPKGFYRT